MTLTLFLLLVPAFALISAVLIYRHNGKRELLQFDIVQFVYGFVIVPLLFVWGKSFMYFLLRQELNLGLSVGELFIIDTIFSTLFLYVAFFAVIHSLTASFKLRKVREPLYDLFEHSEYFHLWLSHLALYGGALGLATFLSVINLFVPLVIVSTKASFYGLLLAGYITGIFSFIGIFLSDPKQANFMRIMKLMIGLFFLIHIAIYFLFDPQFSIRYGLYWFDLMTFLGFVSISLFNDRSERATTFLDRFKYKIGWGENIQVFKKK